MHIDAEETQKRLNRPENLVVILRQRKNGHAFGTGNRGPQIPDELRRLARRSDASKKDLGRMLDCRPDTITEIQNEEEGLSLKDELQAVMTQARGSALDKLNAALAHITAEKMQDANLSVISRVAKDMSGIAKDLIPETKDIGTKVIIYSTPERRKDQYDIIQLSPEEVSIVEGDV